MRSFGGYSTNPSAISFKSAYKKSLLHVKFHEKFSGNCTPLEHLAILHKSSSRSVKQVPQYISEHEFDESLQNSIMVLSFRINWQSYYNVIAHTSGYIARRLIAMLKCNTCCDALIRNVLISEDNGIVMEDVEMVDTEEDDDVYSRDNGVNAANIDINWNGDIDIAGDEDIGYSSDFLDIADDEDDGYSSDFYDDDNDSVIENDMEVDIGQVGDICEKYLDLIKKKNNPS